MNSRIALALALAVATSASQAGGFSFVVNGETFTYTDDERSFSGLIRFPPGSGPFPAIVFNHGQGGAPTGYPNVDAFVGWGAVVIAPTLSHVIGGETAPPTTGHCPENLARGLAVMAALEDLASIDPARIAVFGHSKGAYASIGQVSALGTRVRVAAMTAGGVLPDTAGVDQAAPTHSEALGVVAPFLMFHGNVDGSVPPSRSTDFKNQLDARQIPNLRIEYDVDSYPPNEQHNLHQIPEINADILTQTHAWFTQWGLFAGSVVFADSFE
jgi:dienelactone hydrolase